MKKVFDIVWNKEGRQGKDLQPLPSKSAVPESLYGSDEAIADYLEEKYGAKAEAFCKVVEPLKQPEIARMLMLGTACITKETAKLLDQGATEQMSGINVYPKIGLPLEAVMDAMPEEIERESYGWWIHIPRESRTNGLDWLKDLPSDLWGCIKYAVEHGCDWICFDQVYDTVSGLPEYEW